MCAFSLASRITQRDGTTGRDAPGSRTLLYPATRDRTGGLHRDVHGRPAACWNPGLLDDPGLASASRPRIAQGPYAPSWQPGHPGARSSWPTASRRPGRAPVHPCAVTPDQLHRQGDGPRAAGTTDGDASAPRQSRKPCRRKKSELAPADIWGHDLVGRSRPMRWLWRRSLLLCNGSFVSVAGGRCAVDTGPPDSGSQGGSIAWAIFTVTIKGAGPNTEPYHQRPAATRS